MATRGSWLAPSEGTVNVVKMYFGLVGTWPENLRPSLCQSLGASQNSKCRMGDSTTSGIARYVRAETGRAI